MDSKNHHTIKIIRSFIPPILNDYIASRKWSFEGNFNSFEEASKRCKGYSDKETVDEIKKKFIETRKTKSKKNTLLDPYDQQILSAFFITLGTLDKRDLRVLDLGGGFGAHYYQLKIAAGKKLNLFWDVVETTTLTKEARKLNMNDDLNFYDNIDPLLHKNYDIILTSGTLQYLPDPDDMFLKLRNINHSFLIINRFPIIEEASDRLTIQSVPKSYYSASFPSWFFSNDKWIAAFETGHNINFRWFSMSEVYLGMQKVPFQGFLLGKK
jgi:putative methyltransferase (TIGR04325 family)